MNSALDVARAVAVLEAGGLIGLPTETVYGLAADASSASAVARIFAAKGRPVDHPVIVHLADAAQMDDWAIDIPPAARRLAAAFWPGPLTLILKRAAHVQDAVTGGQASVGLRVPSDPLAHALLAAFAQARAGRPAGIAAPSANKFGRVSPTTAQHVRDEFGAAVDLVLDGGQSVVGIESTIVDCTAERPRLLRPGAITREQVAAVLEQSVAVADAGGATPRVSGSLEAHYAPRTPTRLVATEDLADALKRHADKRVALLAFSSADAPLRQITAPRQAQTYAHALYASLRELDAAGCDLLLVERPPAGAAWDAVNDRLRRAAFGSGG